MGVWAEDTATQYLKTNDIAALANKEAEGMRLLVVWVWRVLVPRLRDVFTVSRLARSV